MPHDTSYHAGGGGSGVSGPGTERLSAGGGGERMSAGGGWRAEPPAFRRATVTSLRVATYNIDCRVCDHAPGTFPEDEEEEEESPPVPGGRRGVRGRAGVTVPRDGYM